MAEENKRKNMQEQDNIELVRILGRDLRGNLKVLVGLTKIKGISWSFSNALCKTLNLDETKTISDLTPKEIERISSFMQEVNLPNFLKNRQKDFGTGEDNHLYGSDLNLKAEFDVKRLRKIKSYRGVRHANKLPVRGQRTKGNFRPNKKQTGATAGKKK